MPVCSACSLIEFNLPDNGDSIEITASAKRVGKTGFEMEALVAVSVSALAIYDMCKAVNKSMAIGEIRLVRKSGGKSELFLAD